MFINLQMLNKPCISEIKKNLDMVYNLFNVFCILLPNTLSSIFESLLISNLGLKFYCCCLYLVGHHSDISITEGLWQCFFGVFFIFLRLMTGSRYSWKSDKFCHESIYFWTVLYLFICLLIYLPFS